MRVLGKVEPVDAGRQSVLGPIVLMGIVQREGDLHHHPRDENRGSREAYVEQPGRVRGVLRLGQ